jgi:hypothetical protein
MTTPKIPQHGDPELLPKPLITRPSARRMPFDQRGVLLPKGPEFDVDRAAPDIEGLPYERFANDEWTSPEQRAEILAFIQKFFKDNEPTFVTWLVKERDRYERVSTPRLRNPFIHLFVTRQEDRRVIDVSVDFPPTYRETIERFRARIAEAGPSLLAVHQQNPVGENCG